MSSSPPLRIGYLVQQFPPEVGAGPARVLEMALRWQDAGAEVTVITGMPNRPEGRIHPPYRGKLFVKENWEGIRVLRSWLYASPRHGFARTILNNTTFMVSSGLNTLLHGGRFDVLIASSPPFFPHITGVAVGSLRRIPLVLEVRDLWPDYLVGMGVVQGRLATSAIFAMERALLRSAERVVVVTDSFRRRVIDKGVAPEHVEIVSNGVDEDVYYPADEPPPFAEMQPREGEPLVGYLGNFGAGQGLRAIVEAAARLASEGSGVRFVLAGDGPDKEAVERRARELGVPNLSIHPPIPKDQTRAFYNACDVCLVPLAPFPILQETVPSKIFEVMACARPVLASLGGEGARIVEQSGAGIVTPPGDPVAIAAGVRRLIGLSAAERRALGDRGREYVRRHYSREALSERYLRLLSSTAAGTTVDPTPAPTLR